MPNQVKVADEVWLAAAILHRRYPSRTDFAIDEIMAAAESADVTGMPLRPSIKVHVYQHCVANKAPNPARYRMLYETSSGRRRLFRPDDPFIQIGQPARTSQHGTRCRRNTVTSSTGITTSSRAPADDAHLFHEWVRGQVVGFEQQAV